MTQKLIDIENKYITAVNQNKFTTQTRGAKIKQKELVNKFDIAALRNKTNVNKKVATLSTKAHLKAKQDKTTKLQAFDSSYFCGKGRFEDDDSIQNIQCFS